VSCYGKNVFLSYAGPDQQHADRLAFICKSRWPRDISDVFSAPKSIAPASRWEKALLVLLRKSDVVMVLWTNKSQFSYGQIVEIGAAWAMEKEIVVVVKDVKESALPFILRSKQAIRWGEFISRFSEWIKGR